MTVITRANSPYKVSSGVTDNGDVVSSGGSMYVLSGGAVVQTTVEAGGLLTVSKGGFEEITILSGAETQRGLGEDSFIYSGGRMTVAAGGTEVIPRISAGGVLDVLAGGVVLGDVNSTLNSGRLETTASGGRIVSSTIDNSGEIAALGTDTESLHHQHDYCR